MAKKVQNRTFLSFDHFILSGNQVGQGIRRYTE